MKLTNSARVGGGSSPVMNEHNIMSSGCVIQALLYSVHTVANSHMLICNQNKFTLVYWSSHKTLGLSSFGLSNEVIVNAKLGQ